jgi:glycosyltransferase involved in cell wall biosynthesis
MSQNLLPFEAREWRRQGWSWVRLKFPLLRWIQCRTFGAANGVIFLTQYARDAVLAVIGRPPESQQIIPHGISPRFFLSPRRQRQPNEFSIKHPCRVLYVSIVDPYKHQWHVADAIAQLRAEGVPVALDLVGPPGQCLGRLRATLQRVDPNEQFISYRGSAPYEKLQELNAAADIGVFASSCETFGLILLEAMAAGLPVACSNRSAMPEILGNAGIYFDPERPEEIASAIRDLISSPALRTEKARAAFERAQAFSWVRCADETFRFLAQVAHSHALHDPMSKNERASLSSTG